MTNNTSTAADRELERVIALALINEDRRFSGFPPAACLEVMPEHHYRDQLRYARAIIAVLPRHTSLAFCAGAAHAVTTEPSGDAVREALETFDQVAKLWGYLEDQGSDEKEMAEAYKEYSDSKAALLATLNTTQTEGEGRDHG